MVSTIAGGDKHPGWTQGDAPSHVTAGNRWPKRRWTPMGSSLAKTAILPVRSVAPSSPAASIQRATSRSESRLDRDHRWRRGEPGERLIIRAQGSRRSIGSGEEKMSGRCRSSWPDAGCHRLSAGPLADVLSCRSLRVSVPGSVVPPTVVTWP